MTVRTIARSKEQMDALRLTGGGGALVIENAAPSTDGGDVGRLIRIRWVFGAEIPVNQGLETVGIQAAYTPTATSTSVLEAVDATAISQGGTFHTGNIQTIAAAVKKTGSSTTPFAAAVALWPGYYASAGTITKLAGLKIYGNSNSGAEAEADDGAITTFFGIEIDSITRTVGTTAVGLTIVQPASGATSNHVMYLQRAGTAGPTVLWAGGTSGNITLNTPAVVTTWTWTLPPTAAGTGGFQLTCAAADGVSTWAGPASSIEHKNVTGLLEPTVALSRIRDLSIHTWRYKPGQGTGDTETEYVGPMAEDAPWAMHYQRSVLSEANIAGHAFAAIAALADKLDALEARMTA